MADPKGAPGLGLFGALRARLMGREGARRILANTFWLVLDKVIRIGVGFLVGVWVARYLGPERFGTLNYAAAWVGLFGVFVTLGMESIVVRDIVKNAEERGALLGTSFLLRTGGSALLVFVSIATTLLIDRGQGDRQLVVFIIALSQLFRPFDTIDLWFQAIVKWKNVFFARNISFLVSSALRVALLLTGQGLIAFAWMYVVDTGLAAIGLAIAGAASKDGPGKWRIDWAIGKRLLVDSWPLALSSIAIVVYMRIDQVMIGRMLGDAQVGVYSAAVRISEIWYFVPSAIAQSVFPSLVQARKKSMDIYWHRMQVMCTSLVWLGIVIALVFQVASGWIIDTLYGREYAAAAVILRVHTWAGIAVALGIAGSNWFTLENRQGLSLISTGVSAIVNIVLNIFFIPWLGAVGAATATIISQMIAAFLVPALIPDVRRLLRVMIRAFLPIPARTKRLEYR